MKSLLLMLLMGCSSLHNQPMVKEGGEHYISPDKNIDIEIIVEKSNLHNPQSYIGKGILKPGTVIPKHAHLASDEYLYFIKGAGIMTIDGKDYEVKDGQTIYIPMGTKHSYENKSEETAEAIQVYTPGGPEQRFKTWSN